MESEIINPDPLKGNRIAIIGLGYVGLPLASAFAGKIATVGFDIDESRIRELQLGEDRTREVTNQELISAKYLFLSSDEADLKACDFYIITVPTPIDDANTPDLTALKAASSLVGSVLKRGSTIIYESTVFPGATEEICIPILEKESGLRLGDGLCVGYSPERINPGDTEHRIENIIKVVSASSTEALDNIACLYELIVTAGVYRAPSIRVAEAAKVIENTQRDLNIGLMNELAIIFDLLNIDTQDVLDAAGTKWNFLPFQPGLVGGHCIGVDPYYLTYKAQQLGYDPQLILAARAINNEMPQFIAKKLIKSCVSRNPNLLEKPCLIMGITFKENCPDVRNSKVFGLIDELNQFGVSVDVWDPWVEGEKFQSTREINFVEYPEYDKYGAIVVAVAHEQFKSIAADEIKRFGKTDAIIFDVKNILSRNISELRL